jgi:hypothetical protein
VLGAKVRVDVLDDRTSSCTCTCSSNLEYLFFNISYEIISVYLIIHSIFPDTILLVSYPSNERRVRVKIVGMRCGTIKQLLNADE